MPHLSNVPTGTALLLDANIFLEHLLSSNAVCGSFFRRLQAGELRGVTSVVVLSEVRHRLLLTEVVRQGHVANTRRALNLLRQRPELLLHLSHACDRWLSVLLELPLRLVSVTPAQFRHAQRLSGRHRLLTNDALHLATLRAHRLHHLASADHDFRRIPHLTVWYP